MNKIELNGAIEKLEKAAGNIEKYPVSSKKEISEAIASIRELCGASLETNEAKSGDLFGGAQPAPRTIFEMPDALANLF
jgi:hypothetical protein